MSKKISFTQGKIIIIGAGPVGCFMAISLAKKGYHVEVYDYRSDMRTKSHNTGQSVNMTIYLRGINALKEIGVWNDVKKRAVLIKGNVQHLLNKDAKFDPISKGSRDVLYVSHRNDLINTLMTESEKLKVRFFFNVRCLRINRKEKQVMFQNVNSNRTFTKRCALIIGADGVNSVVRRELQYAQNINHLQEYLDWGYKESRFHGEIFDHIPYSDSATHHWPNKNGLFIAFPNSDETFTLMMNLPLTGKNSFDSLNSKTKIEIFIRQNFPDLLPALPPITQALLDKPVGKFVTIKTSPWYYQNFMVLIGDAAHGVIPFYGQGMSAGFEDCLLLAKCLDSLRDDQKDFSRYQLLRKRNTDVIAELSKKNFQILKDDTRSAFYINQQKFDTLLNRLIPHLWLPPIYILIAHGTVEYSEAYEKYLRQRKIAKLIGLDFLIYILTLVILFLSPFQTVPKRLNSIIRNQSIRAIVSACVLPIRKLPIYSIK